MTRTVAIIGSAIAGPTLALHILSHPVLRRAFRPVLYDKAPAQGDKHSDRRRGAGATVGLSANGFYPLRSLGLEDVIREHGCEVFTVSAWRADYTGGLEHLTSHKQAMSSSHPETGVFYFERGALQTLLVERVRALGGEVCWSKQAAGYETLAGGRTRVTFKDGTHTEADVLAGADGAFSPTRRFLLDQRNPATAEERWLPAYMGQIGIFGMSRTPAAPNTQVPFTDAHAIYFDRGFMHTGPCAEGVTRWDLMLPAPEPRASSAPPVESDADQAPWEAAIAPSRYPHAQIVDILQRHEAAAHPYVGTIGDLLRSADRIIATPMRQRVRDVDEIQCTYTDGNKPNAVLLGDAARLLLPTSGQGTGFAIEDATVLARLLLHHTDNLPAALAEYAHERVPRGRKTAAMASGMATITAGNNWFTRAVRDYGSKWARAKPGKGLAEGWPFNDRVKLLDE